MTLSLTVKMFKKLSKSRKKHQSAGDVTIYDSANANVARPILKKGNLIVREKQLSMTSEEDISKRNSSKKSKNSKLSEPADHIFYDFHIDIWFLISEYVLPEDIQTFALICTKTAQVVSSAKFWFQIYKKYYDRKIDLPVRLQPECMVRLKGLRSCVIRSLFYTYPPFVHKLKPLTAQDPVCLLKKQIVATWCFQTKDKWNFCYKVRSKQQSKTKTGGRRVVHKKYDEENDDENFHETFCDIFYNTEEGCHILTVMTPSFRPLPNFFGQTSYLQSVIHNLSQGFTTYKLKLTFSNYCNEIIGSVVYDPAVQIKVLNWWNPLYYSYEVQNST